MIDLLSKKEFKVLELCFGLHDGRELIVEEVADNLYLPSSSISRIEAKALRILRHPKNRGQSTLYGKTYDILHH